MHKTGIWTRGQFIPERGQFIPERGQFIPEGGQFIPGKMTFHSRKNDISRQIKISLLFFIIIKLLWLQSDSVRKHGVLRKPNIGVVMKLRTWILTVLTLVFCINLLYGTAASAAEPDEPPDDDETAAMVESITVEDGYFAADFSPDQYDYEVFLNTINYEPDIFVKLTNDRFEYTITGADHIIADDTGNLVTISVSDPLNQYESVEYRLMLYVGTNINDTINWTGLTYLDVENGIFSPQFSRYRVTYYAILEYGIDSFEAAEVNYRTINQDASVEITCRDPLNEDGTIPEGTRVEYVIRVTESDGSSKNYYLNLYRKAAITAAIDDSADLASIKINGGAVKLLFDRHRAFYNVVVPKSVKQLDIQAYPDDRSDMAYILGPTCMNEREPIVVNILVVSPSEDTYSVYTLRLYYDNFTSTEKYSSLQLMLYLAACGVCMFCGGFFAASIMKKRRK